MHVSNTIARWLCSQPRIVGNNRQELLVVTGHEKEQDVTGAGGHVGAGHHFSRVLVPADKHNTVQHKSKDEAPKGAQTVGEDQDHPRPQSPLLHFQKGLKEQSARN